MLVALAFTTLLSISLVFGQVIPTNLVPAMMGLDAGWSPMIFNMTESEWVKNVFKVIAPVPIRVIYSDAFCPGKMISLYVNGSFFMNSTQVPLSICDPRLPLPSAALAFPEKFSRAEFDLPVGEHSIAAKVIQSDPTIPAGLMYLRAIISIPFSCGKD